MTDTADELIQATGDSLWAPESLKEVRDRLEYIDAHECHCGEGPHANALHDLAHDDVPVLLRVIEQLAPRRIVPTTDIVERAQDALEGTTSGPWDVRDGFVYPLAIRCGLGAIRTQDGEFIAQARTLVPELVSALREAQANAAAARQIIEELTDPDPCSFDHHGGCQAHGFFDLTPENPCGHEKAKRFLAAEAS